MSLIQALLRLAFGWSVVFGGKTEPGVHWRAAYVDRTGGHIVEAWRVPGHVRRVTDEALELDAEQSAEAGYRFLLNDRRRGLTYHGDQHQRIMQGVFNDWQSWTRVVAPLAPDPLVFALARPPTKTAAGRCTWYGEGVREICWSRELALPILIRAQGAVVYAVTTAEAFSGELTTVAPVGPEIGQEDD